MAPHPHKNGPALKTQGGAAFNRAPGALVLGFVDQAALGDPGHHGAQLFADLFREMLG